MATENLVGAFFLPLAEMPGSGMRGCRFSLQAPSIACPQCGYDAVPRSGGGGKNVRSRSAEQACAPFRLYDQEVVVRQLSGIDVREQDRSSIAQMNHCIRTGLGNAQV